MDQVTEVEPSAEDHWRNLALQYDAQRMRYRDMLREIAKNPVVRESRARSILEEFEKLDAAPHEPLYKVEVIYMTESNGNAWYSVFLHTGSIIKNSYQVYRDEIKGRAEYEAACLRYTLDQSLPHPCILDFDTDPPEGYKWNIDVPPELDVRKILLDVVPGDGSGHEVYAASVADVERYLTEQGERIEQYQSQASNVPSVNDENLLRIAHASGFVQTAYVDMYEAHKGNVLSFARTLLACQLATVAGLARATILDEAIAAAESRLAESEPDYDPSFWNQAVSQCASAIRALQKHKEFGYSYIGCVQPEGDVKWFNQNPHSFPNGTNFFAIETRKENT